MNAASRNVNLEWREAGSGKPLILLHAFPLNSAMWGKQLAGPPPGWRLIAPDLRGFGGSPDADDAVYTMDLMAGDVLALMDRLQLRSPVICGISMGGYVALEMWRQHPDRVRALILADTRAGPDSPEAARARERLAQRVEKEGIDVVIETMLPKLLSTTTRYHNKGIVSAVAAMMKEAGPGAIARTLRGMAARRDSEPLLRTISVPGLVVVGAEDVITGRGQSEFLARSIPGAWLETIDDAGHLPPMERADEFNRVVKTFLSRLPQVAHA